MDGLKVGVKDGAVLGVIEGFTVGTLLGVIDGFKVDVKKLHVWEEEGVPVKMSVGEMMTVPNQETHFNAVR